MHPDSRQQVLRPLAQTRAQAGQRAVRPRVVPGGVEEGFGRENETVPGLLRGQGSQAEHNCW